jgi:hypothetical protein
MLSRWVLLAVMSVLTVLMGCAPDVPTDHVTLEQARADHEAGKVMLVDIRETREHKTGVAAGAVLLPMSELPKKQMFARLKEEVRAWEKADPTTPVMPALHYIVTTAQEAPGSTGKYRLRMPNAEIDKVMAMAEEINAIVFLDIQVGLSSLKEEIPVIEKYLKHPRVHLGIDPEFSMKGGQKPGTVIGSFDASDINYAASYLADLVKKNDLPPKILVIHRFTQGMLKEYKQIKNIPEVQFVLDMDGWGSPARKINTYKLFAHREPIQFTGFKLFYKNDLKEAPHRLLTIKELLALKPIPLYIQYQ